MSHFSRTGSGEGGEQGLTTTAYDDQFVFPEKLSLRGGGGASVSEERRVSSAGRTLDIVEGKNRLWEGLKRVE